MNAETIKDFLVSLGFQVDEAGARKFDTVIAGTTAQAVKLGVAVEATALSVFAFTAKIASGLDQLYWASQRTGATVAGIQAIGYAASQAGSSAEAARGSLESLSRFLRNNPGAEGFLNRLGVQTRDASGNMRDMASIFTGVGQQLNKMPYYRANQYAQMLGIDENTLMAMRRGMGQFGAQYSQMAKAIGFNADQAAVSSNRFMTSLRAFSQMAGMASQKIGSNLTEGLAGSIDTLRKQIVDNFPKIEQVITSGVKGILWLADVIGRVIYRLIQAGADIAGWWTSLDKSTQRLIEVFGALVIAWRALNSAFVMSPIGIITSLGVAILALYDDYKTWKEGGQSFIDWKKWEPQIKGAIKGVKDLTEAVMRLLDIDPQKWTAKWDMSNLISNFGELAKMLDGIARLLNAIKDGRWKDAYAIGRELMSQGQGSPDALPSVTSSANSAAEWLKSKTGFDPRSIGRWLSGGGNLPDRNNNPGNIRSLSGGGFRSFNSAVEGWDAMRNQLMRYFTGKTTGRALTTISDIISTWAPSSENDTAKYISDVSKWMGVNPDAALNLNNPQVMTSLMQSMARKEGFSEWNSPLAARAAGSQINQETNIHIHGVSDPGRAASEVAEKQMDVNSRFSQALGTGPR
ncbi:hypothetical protein SD377_000776 [Cronobacter turicensis]|nr:hypothetical protein [Cronobacter turicensis]EMA1790109.1 hypothetical protein [Cronobacter turicensis]EMA1800173.1 hypothetical protein [Cronobacter turicensis]EMA1847386.1 hypothetical protein [Cronobacter turicensis]EMA1857631.1 hypothetical protein [Cronobacter turicensis]